MRRLGCKGTSGGARPAVADDHNSKCAFTARKRIRMLLREGASLGGVDAPAHRSGRRRNGVCSAASTCRIVSVADPDARAETTMVGPLPRLRNVRDEDVRAMKMSGPHVAFLVARANRRAVGIAESWVSPSITGRPF